MAYLFRSAADCWEPSVVPSGLAVSYMHLPSCYGKLLNVVFVAPIIDVCLMLPQQDTGHLITEARS
jgi:hypothetical protein